jgi:hypothetical protein
VTPNPENKMSVDYQKLFTKYLKHVHNIEESLFLELIDSPFSNISFTTEELKVLRSIEAELHPAE